MQTPYPMAVLRDAEGVLQHIGEWEYHIVVDDGGESTCYNPMPDGYVSTIEDVVDGLDGGRYLATDPRAYTKE